MNKLYKIRKKEKQTMTRAVMDNPRFMPGGSVSFFKISTKAKQKEIIMNVVINSMLDKPMFTTYTLSL